MEARDEAGLIAPKEYFEASDLERDAVVNQCGPNGGLGQLVPNSLLGLDVGPSCDIHDWTHGAAESEKDHQRSDRVFLENMKRQIACSESSGVLKLLRYGLAYLYFGAARIYSKATKFASQSDEKMEDKYL